MTHSTSPPFSETAWTAVAGRYADIVEHPFVERLMAGTLDHDVFVRYLVDDAHYLASYARTLAAVASRMPTSEGVAALAGAAAGAITAERGLHRGFLSPLGLDPDDPSSTARPTQTCRGYTGFLAEQAAVAPVEVALAAVLPCFRVYAEVGRHVAEHRPPGEHPYAAWIETYSDSEFDDAVRRAEGQADELAEAAPHRRPAMLEAYAVSTDFEWRFFDAPWRAEAAVGPIPQT